MTDNHVHVSDLRWDRRLAGELDAEAKAATDVAIDECPACAARWAELVRDHAGFPQRPPLVLARRRRWWPVVPVGVLAAAAAVVLVVRGGGDGEGGGERVKGGGASLVVAAGPQGRVAPVTSGDRVRPGDFVQAGYSATRAGFGTVLARDGSGAAMTYVPSRGDAMVALAAGELRSYPESTVLDDVVGEEILIVVWCEAAQPLAPLVAELGTRGDITPPAGCTHRRVVLDKHGGP